MWAASCVEPSAEIVTVAGPPPASFEASLSANEAVTSSEDSPISVTKPGVDEPDDEDELLTGVRPPPAVVWPTMPLTAATVPPSGARSVVCASVRCAAVKFVSACTTALRSCASVLAVGGACLTARPSDPEVTPSLADAILCGSAATVVQAGVAAGVGLLLRDGGAVVREVGAQLLVRLRKRRVRGLRVGLRGGLSVRERRLGARDRECVLPALCGGLAGERGLEVRARARERGFGLLRARRGGGRVDLPQDLALRHAPAGLHVDLGERAGRLEVERELVRCGDAAGRRHRREHDAALDGARLLDRRVRRRRLRLNDAVRERGDPACDEDEPEIQPAEPAAAEARRTAGDGCCEGAHATTIAPG